MALSKRGHILHLLLFHCYARARGRSEKREGKLRVILSSCFWLYNGAIASRNILVVIQYIGRVAEAGNSDIKMH